MPVYKRSDKTMKIITHKACPLCNSNNITKKCTCKDHFATGESFDIFRCDDCGFTFTQGIPDEKEIGHYYESSDYISHSNTNKGLTNKLYHIARNFMLMRKVSLVKKLTLLRHGKLLDYGAGIGHFARAIQRQGWDITAIEKNEKARAHSKEVFNFEILPEESFKELEPQSYDVITLWHVMEHLQNLDDFWEQAKKLLDESGIMIVAVPNCASYDAENYGEHWAAYDVPRHLWHFTSSTMLRLGDKHGFILERRYPMPLDSFYISILSERYKNSKIPFIKGMWNGFLGWIATLDKCSAASSIIYVFRKKR